MIINNILYKRTIKINDKISIIIPTVGEILEDEMNYNRVVDLIVSMPIDKMVELDDMGIDFSTIDEYQLFLIVFSVLKEMDTKLVFGELDLSLFNLGISESNGMVCLVDTKNDIVIDKGVYENIASTLRLIHHIKKDTRQPANKEAKEYMIRRARQKAMRRKNKSHVSNLESLIVSMVNTEQYKYGYADTLGLSIYQFNESVIQIINKINYDNRMHGVYSGVIDVKGLSQDDMNWLKHK